MKEIENFYKNTEELSAHKELVDFINRKNIKGTAVDIGCGAGRDTIFLLKSGWGVLGVDKENVISLIDQKLTNEQKNNFLFLNDIIENVNLPKCDLIVAYNSLPFCNKSEFDKVWQKICFCLKEGGHFVGTFFGTNDDWAKSKKDLVFVSKEKCLELFEGFNLLRFEEIEEDNMSAVGENKYWHIFTIVAQKKSTIKR